MKILRKTLLPLLMAFIYWLWSRTWRLKVLEDPAFLEARRQGPIIFAHWHGDEMVVLRLGSRYHCAAMTSTSEDGELMTRILKIFGFGVSRGSSTRGGARAAIGMLNLMKAGYSGTVAVDGPRGPRHKVKPGIWFLAKHADAQIIPTGVAPQKAFVFQKSWNKTFLPWPFSKVVVSFGPPVPHQQEFSEQNAEKLSSLLEEKLHQEHKRARAFLLSMLFLFLVGCSSNPTVPSAAVHVPLQPVGRVYSGDNAAVIRHLLSGSAAKTAGFQVNDEILHLNNIEIRTAAEFEKKIKGAPKLSVIEIKRRGQKKQIQVLLREGKTRFGAGFEPSGVALIKRTSPLIAHMHKDDLTIFAQTSTNETKDTLFTHLILDSYKIRPTARLRLTLLEGPEKKPVAKSEQILDALGSGSRIVSKSFPLRGSFERPLRLALDVDKDRFLFEFQ